jgi:hypothetical protein
MIKRGTTLRGNLAPRHIWIVITDPHRTNGDILLVNLTTFHDGCVDDTCILGPADYTYLRVRSTVAYSRAWVCSVQQLDRAILGGNFTELEPMPGAALQKILSGAMPSRELSKARQRLIG